MTPRQILEKAIGLAIAGGWYMFGHRRDNIPPWYIVEGGQMPTPKVVEAWVPENSLLICSYDDHYYVWEHVIYSHDFARALWGEDLVHGFKGNTLGQIHQFHSPAWQHHLQQMVLEDDPITYLGAHLPEEANHE